MRGVTIKNEVTAREIDKTALVSVLIGVTMVIVLGAATVVKHWKTESFGLVILVAVAVVSMIAYAVMMWNGYHNTWPEYIVEVDDSVNFNEFMEKYEIVGEEEENNTYRVKER